jgi:hypothetical protein
VTPYDGRGTWFDGRARADRIDVLHVLRAEELDRNAIPSEGRLKLTPVTVDSVQDDG